MKPPSSGEKRAALLKPITGESDIAKRQNVVTRLAVRPPRKGARLMAQWAIEVAGFEADGPHVVEAPTRSAAVYQDWKAYREAGYGRGETLIDFRRKVTIRQHEAEGCPLCGLSRPHTHTN